MTTLRVIALMCLVVLAQFHVRQVATSSIQYDDAHNANIAKNLAFGFGYSTSYHDIVLFNPEATTGPVVLLPAAAFVRLVGNRYWVPTFAIVVCLWIALGLVLWLLRQYLKPAAWWIALALIAIGLAVYDADEFGLLGDVPGALLAVASVLILCRGVSGRRMLAAGLLLGVAIQTKLLVLFVVPAAIAYLLVSRVEHRGRAVAQFCTGVVAPTVVWSVYQLAALRSLQSWMSLNASYFTFVRTWSGVNIVQSMGFSEALQHQVGLHVASMLEDFHGWIPLVLFPIALVVSAIAFFRTRTPHDTPLGAAAGVLVAAAGIHTLWWFALDTDGWYRHLLPAVVYLLVASSMIAAANAVASRKAGVVGLCLLIGSMAPQLANLQYVFRPFRRETRLSALLATRDEMILLRRDRNVVFVGYGWWVPRDLEYVLPTVGNFKDVLRLRPEDVAGKTIVLVRNEFFNREHNQYTHMFQEACDRLTIFAREPFVISECLSLPGDIR